MRRCSSRPASSPRDARPRSTRWCDRLLAFGSRAGGSHRLGERGHAAADRGGKGEGPRERRRALRLGPEGRLCRTRGSNAFSTRTFSSTRLRRGNRDPRRAPRLQNGWFSTLCSACRANPWPSSSRWRGVSRCLRTNHIDNWLLFLGNCPFVARRPTLCPRRSRHRPALSNHLLRRRPSRRGRAPRRARSSTPKISTTVRSTARSGPSIHFSSF